MLRRHFSDLEENHEPGRRIQIGSLTNAIENVDGHDLAGAAM
jgi:hypothetical protein